MLGGPVMPCLTKARAAANVAAVTEKVMAPGYMANQRRIANLMPALDAFCRKNHSRNTFAELLERNTEAAMLAVQDLMGDLLHVVVAHGWDVDTVVAAGRRHFDYENAPGYEGD